MWHLKGPVHVKDLPPLRASWEDWSFPYTFVLTGGLITIVERVSSGLTTLDELGAAARVVAFAGFFGGLMLSLVGAGIFLRYNSVPERLLILSSSTWLLALLALEETRWNAIAGLWSVSGLAILTWLIFTRRTPQVQQRSWLDSHQEDVKRAVDALGQTAVLVLDTLIGKVLPDIGSINSAPTRLRRKYFEHRAYLWALNQDVDAYKLEENPTTEATSNDTRLNRTGGGGYR
jgi:hypothetical protein